MGFYSDDPPSKDGRIHTRFGTGKTQRYAAKPEKIRIDDLSYQPEKVYTEALLEVLSKAIAEEINAVFFFLPSLSIAFRKPYSQKCYSPVI